MLTATIVSFHEVSPTAAYLLVPYYGWSLFAAGLTLSIYKKNPKVIAPLLLSQGVTTGGRCL
jgi:tryptophan-rich sensory protein